VVEFLNNSQLSVNHRDFKDIGYEDALLKLSVSASREVYRHAFALSQAYTADLMPYTNYTSVQANVFLTYFEFGVSGVLGMGQRLLDNFC